MFHNFGMDTQIFTSHSKYVTGSHTYIIIHLFILDNLSLGLSLGVFPLDNYYVGPYRTFKVDKTWGFAVLYEHFQLCNK